MDEEISDKVETKTESIDNREMEIKCLYREVRKETEELKQLMMKHLEYLQQPRNQQWLTSAEVQNYLRISKPTLKRYRDNHCLRSTYVYGRLRYSYDDILKIMKRNR